MTSKKLFLLIAYLLFLSLLAIGLVWTEFSKQNAESLSFTQVILFISFLLFAIFLIFLLFLFRQVPTLANSTITKTQSFLGETRNWWRFFSVNLLVFLGCIYLTTLAQNTKEPFTAGILGRTQIILLYIIGLSSSVFAVLFINAPHLKQKARDLMNSSFSITIHIVILIMAGWFWVVDNGIEQESQITGWNPQGAPVLETQVLIAWLFGTGIMILVFLLSRNFSFNRLVKGISNWKIDLLVMILLWSVSTYLWSTTPIASNWFLSEKRAPNFEYYPNTDAVIYDSTAQDQLVGEGFRVFGTPYVRRPLHALVLTFLHSLGGQNYENYIFFQVIVLALLPPLFYLLGLMLHNRVSGLIIAIIVSLREYNSIALAGSITTSNAKVLLADMLTFLTVMIFIVAATNWLKKLEKPGLAPIFAGSALGLPILIRPETGSYALVILILMGILLGIKKNYQLLLKSTLLFLIGLGCILSPWIIRNYQKTGMIFIDSPYFFYEILEQRYGNPQGTDLPPVELNTSGSPLDESDLQKLSSGNGSVVNLESEEVVTSATPSPEEEYIETVKQKTIAFFRNNPSEVFRFFASHYLNSQIQTFLVAPTTIRPVESLISFSGHRDLERFSSDCCSAIGYIRRLPYWHKWNGIFPSDALFLLILNLLLLSWGVHIAWKRYRWAGLFPIFVSLMHFWMNALFRNSGGRYILPMDWTGIFYYSIGLTEITANSLSSIKDKMKLSELEASCDKISFASRFPNRIKLLITILLLSGLGFSIPLFEMNTSRKYTESVKKQMLDSLYADSFLQTSEKQTIQNFLNEGGDVLAGRALYPRFFPKDQGEPGSTNPFGPRDFSRVGFYLAGPKSEFVIVPKLEKIKNFPNASDVLVFACSESDVLAVAVFEFNSLKQMIWRSPLPDHIECPLEQN